jgi:hypothetical protein
LLRLRPGELLPAGRPTKNSQRSTSAKGHQMLMRCASFKIWLLLRDGCATSIQSRGNPNDFVAVGHHQTGR